jgi:hypothetical protein
MRETVNVNDGNASEFAVVRDSLKENLEWLADVTKDYPVECVFSGRSFVFESKGEIEEMIAFLDQRLSELNVAA